MNCLSSSLQQTYSDSLQALKEGNHRFCTNQSLHTRQDMARVAELKDDQRPFAVIVGCSDSRVTPEIIFDQGLGDLFSIRTAGNVMGSYEVGSVEYAVEHLGTTLVVVLGHTGCGAVKAFIDTMQNNDYQVFSEKSNHIQSIINRLASQHEMHEIFASDHCIVYYNAVKANVIHGVNQLRASNLLLSKKYKKGELLIIGAIYHIETGKVEFLNS